MKENIQPIGPPQVPIPDILQMAATSDGTTLLCLQVQDGFCQAQLLQIKPNGCLHPWTLKELDSIPL